MQYRLKNVEKSGASKMSALELATQIEKQIQQKFDDVQLLRVDVNEQQEFIITSVYENNDQNNKYNRFMDVQFLKDILQVEELLQDEEDEDYEDIDNEVVTDYKFQQLKQAIDCFFEFSKDLDQVKQMQLENKFKSIIGNTANKEQKLQIKILVQCKGSQVVHLHQEKLFLNGPEKDPAFIDLISQNHFVNPDITNMMNSNLIKVQSFSIGMLQFIQEQQQLQLQQFFTSAQFQRQMSMPYQIYIKETKGNEKCLQLILGFMHQFSIRIDIDLTLCQTVYQQDQMSFYFKMLSPPSCYAAYHGKWKYENNLIKSQFVKVDNIFLNHLVISEKINEIQRLLFLNNTTILVKLDQNSDYFRQKLQSFHVINAIDYPVAHIKLQNDISYSRLMNSKYLNFSLRFNILAAISQNKLNKQKSIQELIETCESGYKKLSEKQTQDLNGIFEQTFNTFCKVTSNLSLIDEKETEKKNENHLRYFKNVFKRTQQDFIELRDPTMRLVYTRRVSMTPSGILYFNKQPEVTSGILRQHYNIVEYFLRVHYEDENQDMVLNIPYITQTYYYNFMFPTLKILGQHFELFTWSSSSLRAGTCWFIDFNGAGKQRTDIIKSIGNFTNLKYDEIAKNAARLGQNLSTSISVDCVGGINILIKDDLVDKNNKLYTDGIGKISQDLIDQIRQKMRVNSKIKISAIQIRYEGAKGLLVLDESLEQKTIVLRRSMIKYNPAKGYPNKIQILDFNKFRGGYLNRQIIILLLTLQVNEKAFQELQDEYLKKIEDLQMKDASIYKYFSVDYCDEQIDLPNIMDALRAYINIGMEDNILCQGVLSKLKQRGLLQLRKKTSILVEKAARVLGVIDEHNLLQPNEIYCLVQDENNDTQVEPENIQGEVLVTRNPCLHPGDIKKLNAISTQEILKRNGSKNPYSQLINCLVFPACGNSLPCQIAGGDLDGDLYFICWDNRLLPPVQAKSMVYDNKKPNQVQYKKIDFRENNQRFHENVDKNFDTKNMFDFLYFYLNSETLGLIDNSHLAWADKSDKKANDPNCLELAELHSDAVDFVKTGKQVFLDVKLLSKIFPDYMEKEQSVTYESQTIIGKLYRQVAQMGIQQDNSLSQGLGFKQNNLPKIEYKLLYNFDKLIAVCKQIKQDCKITINLEEKKKEQNELQQEVQEEVIIEELIQLIQKYIDDNFKRHLDSALKLILLIFESIFGITQTFAVKSEFEIYSGNFSSLQKGDGLYQKKKLNVEKYQKRIIALIGQLHQEVERKLQALSEIERLQRISLINFILTYSPNSHPYPTYTILGEFISQLMKQIECFDAWKQLLNIHSIWYRGVGQYLFWKDLQKIFKSDEEELI
ncbi:unnamed protein product (macronuclear) [Paramecium tetraurelia]|nr:uncharacterized protein GSPATT00036857001 [Paramecium tetraurelia]CAK68074.1 unnamed protein product [Paramecium tetraurelia]|eukprot:XP_001435471.1 hypothetical protein (macronuclear) [Paramecium tetraurelia strain d4-2]